jgi:hypothetical protein
VSSDPAINKERPALPQDRHRPQSKSNSKQPARANKFGLILRQKRDNNTKLNSPKPTSNILNFKKKSQQKNTLLCHEKHQEYDINFSPSHTATAFSHSKICEQNPNIAAQARAFSQKDDDINRLLKKLTMSFIAKKHQSQFVIGHGVFMGAKFHILTNDRDVSLHIINASVEAKNLVHEHSGLLKSRLANREINLKDLRFVL